MSQREQRKQITKAQKDLTAYERSHKLSASARHNMNKAQAALAQAQNAYVDEGYDEKLAQAQKVLDFITERGIRGIAFGGGVPDL